MKKRFLWECFSCSSRRYWLSWSLIRAQVKQRLNKYIWVVMLTLLVQYNCPLITYYLKSLQSWCKLELTDHRSVTGSGTGQIWMSCKWEQQRTRAGCSFFGGGQSPGCRCGPKWGLQWISKLDCYERTSLCDRRHRAVMIKWLNLTLVESGMSESFATEQRSFESSSLTTDQMVP